MMGRHNHLLALNESTGTLSAKAGVTLAEIIDAVVPRGFFPPVVPGTSQVTLGGMVAADVHGKNHHGAGSFSRHVTGLDVVLSDGRQVHCSLDEYPDLFAATCGGMGLTGVITGIQFTLLRIATSRISQEIRRNATLEATLEAFADSGNWTYSVAWLDGLAGGRHLGRSVLFLGEHATPDELPAPLQTRPLSLDAKGRGARIPPGTPSVLCRPLVGAFNDLYYHLPRPRRALMGLASFFHPLDRIHGWNRLYGRRGFVQYQCVLPLAASHDGLRRIIERAQSEGPFLAVLKRFGDLPGRGLLSFPMAGHTLSLDFPATPGLRKVLAELDRIVADYGGRLYLAKDAITQSCALVAEKADLDRFRALRQRYDPRGAFSSTSIGTSRTMNTFPPPSALILGACSDLARAVAHRYGRAGASLILAARQPERLAADAEDLRLRYRIEVQVAGFDALDVETAEDIVSGWEPLPDTVVCAVGLIGDDAGPIAAADIIATNLTGPAVILRSIAQRMEKRGSGTIIGFSSVAGERGKARNLVYGSAKAGFTAFLSGLRNRLCGSGVTVITVKPGFCRTRMTEGMTLPSLLTATPEQVAEAVFNAQKHRRDVVYVLPIWRVIMIAIRLLPERLFKRLRL